jgi:TolB-like protein
MTGDPSQEYLADGMTDALIGRLSTIHSLRVISRTSVMRFKKPQISVPEIAKTLNVDAIVEGSLMRDGNRIRVTAQMVRASTAEHFWSQTYDRELRDVFTVQSELAQSIAEKVEATASGAEQERLAAARPVAPEVYDSYSRGEFALNKSSSKAELEASISYFEDAVKRDPGFAPAYVGLANAYSNLGAVFIGGSAEETRPKVVSAAEKALELDPNLAEALVLLASTKQKHGTGRMQRRITGALSSWTRTARLLTRGLLFGWHAKDARTKLWHRPNAVGNSTHLGFPSRTSGGRCFRPATTTKPSESCALHWPHGRMTLAPSWTWDSC